MRACLPASQPCLLSLWQSVEWWLFIFISVPKDHSRAFLYFLENWAVIRIELDHLFRESVFLGLWFLLLKVETCDKRFQMACEICFPVACLPLAKIKWGRHFYQHDDWVSILRGLGTTPDHSIPLHPQFQAHPKQTHVVRLKETIYCIITSTHCPFKKP